MSEKMLRIPLSDLKTVRVLCKQCHRGVIEVPIERFDLALDRGSCRLCRRDVLPDPPPDGQQDPLRAICLAVEELKRLADKLGIEFEIPAP